MVTAVMEIGIKPLSTIYIQFLSDLHILQVAFL